MALSPSARFRMAMVFLAGIAEAAEAVLAQDAVAYVHLRSAKNNCYT